MTSWAEEGRRNFVCSTKCLTIHWRKTETVTQHDEELKNTRERYKQLVHYCHESRGHFCLFSILWKIEEIIFHLESFSCNSQQCISWVECWIVYNNVSMDMTWQWKLIMFWVLMKRCDFEWTKLWWKFNFVLHSCLIFGSVKCLWKCFGVPQSLNTDVL